MTVNIIDCEIKQFRSAMRTQQGHRTVYLDNVYRIGPLVAEIRKEIDTQKTMAQAMGMDTKNKRSQLRHGARSKTLFKSMEAAWTDLEKKLDKFDENLNTNKPVNWAEGEIKMFNGLTEIIDQEMQVKGLDRDEYAQDTVFVLRLRDGNRCVCRYPLPEISVEWRDDEPGFERINRAIDHINQVQPNKVF